MEAVVKDRFQSGRGGRWVMGPKQWRFEVARRTSDVKIALVDFVRKVWSFRYGVRTRAHRRGGGQTVQGFQH